MVIVPPDLTVMLRRCTESMAGASGLTECNNHVFGPIPLRRSFLIEHVLSEPLEAHI